MRLVEGRGFLPVTFRLGLARGGAGPLPLLG
jgi:hypothetical protein